MGILVMTLFIGGLVGIVMAIIGLIEWVDWKLILIGLLITTVCWFIADGIIDNAPYRDINNSNIIVEYARINQITEKTITLDNRTFARINSKALEETFNKIYPINLGEFEIGEIVKYQYISTDFNDYLIKIEKVK